jgi:uncharacterized membrane protein YozB (DUF420 family)
MAKKKKAIGNGNRGLWILHANGDQIALTSASLLTFTIVTAGIWQGTDSGPALMHAAFTFAIAYIVIYLLFLYFRHSTEAAVESEKVIEKPVEKTDVPGE